MWYGCELFKKQRRLKRLRGTVIISLLRGCVVQMLYAATGVCCFALLVCGCTILQKESSETEDLLRLNTRYMRFNSRCLLEQVRPGERTIKLVVKESAHPVDLYIWPFYIQSGEVSFFGRDGSLTMTAKSQATVKKRGQEDWTFEAEYPDAFSFRIWPQKVQEDSFLHCINIRNYLPQKGCGDRNGSHRKMKELLGPELFVAHSNGLWYVEIPYKTSSDFAGELGRLFLSSNWYD